MASLECPFSTISVCFFFFLSLFCFIFPILILWRPEIVIHCRVAHCIARATLFTAIINTQHSDCVYAQYKGIRRSRSESWQQYPAVSCLVCRLCCVDSRYLLCSSKELKNVEKKKKKKRKTSWIPEMTRLASSSSSSSSNKNRSRQTPKTNVLSLCTRLWICTQIQNTFHTFHSQWRTRKKEEEEETRQVSTSSNNNNNSFKVH